MITAKSFREKRTRDGCTELECERADRGVCSGAHGAISCEDRRTFCEDEHFRRELDGSLLGPTRGEPRWWSAGPIGSQDCVLNIVWQVQNERATFRIEMCKGRIERGPEHSHVLYDAPAPAVSWLNAC